MNKINPFAIPSNFHNAIILRTNKTSQSRIHGSKSRIPRDPKPSNPGYSSKHLVYPRIWSNQYILLEEIETEEEGTSGVLEDVSRARKPRAGNRAESRSIWTRPLARLLPWERTKLYRRLPLMKRDP